MSLLAVLVLGTPVEPSAQAQAAAAKLQVQEEAQHRTEVAACLRRQGRRVTELAKAFEAARTDIARARARREMDFLLEFTCFNSQGTIGDSSPVAGGPAATGEIRLTDARLSSRADQATMRALARNKGHLRTCMRRFLQSAPQTDHLLLALEVDADGSVKKSEAFGAPTSAHRCFSGAASTLRLPKGKNARVVTVRVEPVHK